VCIAYHGRWHKPAPLPPARPPRAVCIAYHGRWHKPASAAPSQATAGGVHCLPRAVAQALTNPGD